MVKLICPSSSPYFLFSFSFFFCTIRISREKHKNVTISTKGVFYYFASSYFIYLHFFFYIINQHIFKKFSFNALIKFTYIPFVLSMFTNIFRVFCIHHVWMGQCVYMYINRLLDLFASFAYYFGGNQLQEELN